MTSPSFRAPLDPRPAAVSVKMLMWTDPTGRCWIAPLGSPEPGPAGPPAPAWLPITIEHRTDQL